MFCNPLPTNEELDLYYSTEFNYGWYSKRKMLLQIQSYHRWLRFGKRLEKSIVHKGILLDIGCGHGWFIQAARRAGWNVAGVDLSTIAVDYAREKLGLHVVRGSLESVELSLQNYAVVTMWHSLEHMIYPIEALKKVRSLLKPGGLILIAVPNVNCLGQRRQGRNWVWLQQPFVHIWHFSTQTIQMVLEKSGFEVISVETRDTWNAQYLYDGILRHKLEDKYFRMLSRLGVKVIPWLRLKIFFCEGIHFYLSEVSRILMYIPYLVIRPLVVRLNKENGSELLVIARVKNGFSN